MEVADVSATTLYGKIDFIHRQCLAFIANRERKMMGTAFTENLYLSTDRQIYYLNWTKRRDKRTSSFEAVGTADNKSSYVFGMHLNFEPRLNASRIEDWAQRCNDYDRPMAMRRHAHIWLRSDFVQNVKNSSGKASLLERARHDEDIVEKRYEHTSERTDVESAAFMDSDVKLPVKGVQIHNEYTLYAHFQLMAKMFSGVNKPQSSQLSLNKKAI
ncbi:MAG: hypothetical protein PSN44_08420 [Gammaproteobacteria bacterium]|nr:hypothetical protein [Gammaproteobacteria bacterium]